MTADSAENDRVPPRSGHRAFRHVVPSSEEISRARSLPADACPRRYCWWWRTLSFEWELTPAEGCAVTTAAKPKSWRGPERPVCRRCDPAAAVDWYEPRSGEIAVDGIAETAERWMAAMLAHWKEREAAAPKDDLGTE